MTQEQIEEIKATRFYQPESLSRRECNEQYDEMMGYIADLLSHIDELQKERDAMAKDLGKRPCTICRHERIPGEPTPERCWAISGTDEDCFVWRGVQDKP